MTCRAKVVSTLRRAVHKYGSDTAGLLNQVYTTAPMVRGAPGSVLELWAAEPRESYAAATTDTPTAKQRKKRKARIASAKEEIKKRLADRRRTRIRPGQAPPPRYDDVFFEGLLWLDGLASAAG